METGHPRVPPFGDNPCARLPVRKLSKLQNLEILVEATLHRPNHSWIYFTAPPQFPNSEGED